MVRRDDKQSIMAYIDICGGCSSPQVLQAENRGRPLSEERANHGISREGLFPVPQFFFDFFDFNFDHHSLLLNRQSILLPAFSLYLSSSLSTLIV
jgi:hypothetical protein